MSLSEDPSGKKYVITKGAPDVLVNKSESILWDGRQALMDRDQNKKVVTAVNSLAEQALRTIAVAFKPINASNYPQNEEDVEKGFTFIGLQGMIDPFASRSGSCRC